MEKYKWMFLWAILVPFDFDREYDFDGCTVPGIQREDQHRGQLEACF
jgi:hypothetical protein